MSNPAERLKAITKEHGNGPLVCTSGKCHLDVADLRALLRAGETARQVVDMFRMWERAPHDQAAAGLTGGAVDELREALKEVGL